MKKLFATDAFTSLSGLSAVAYGNPDFFREIQNQIFSQSATWAFDFHRPSSVFLSFVNKARILRVFTEALEEQYQTDEAFKAYIDVLETSAGDFADKTLFFLEKLLDYISSYDVPYVEYISEAVSNATKFFSRNRALYAYIEQSTIVESLVNGLKADKVLGPDAELVFNIVANNPQTKISAVKPNTVIPIDQSVELGLDYRGVEIELGYLSISDYYSGLAYRGVTL